MDIDNCQFLNGISNLGGALYISGDSIIRISRSSFINNQANSKGGAIYTSGFQSIYIGEGTQFIDNSAVEIGEDFYITNSKNILTLNNNCTAQIGGAIYSENAQSVKIINSTFSQNKALIGQNSLHKIANQGAGGAIYYTCNSQELNCKMKFEGFNIFKDNLAEVKGGALFWDQLEPEFSRNDMFFSNNIAQLYGNDIACYSQNLQTISLQEYQNQLIEIGLYSNQDFQSRILEFQNKVISHRFLEEINFHRSGDKIPIMFLALIDKYGQIVGSDFQSKIRIIIETTNLDEQQSLYYPILEGIITYDMIGGVSVIQNIQISVKNNQAVVKSVQLKKQYVMEDLKLGLYQDFGEVAINLQISCYVYLNTPAWE
ncbi:UNKNOWN [Stylonychia lemnae]|uniref:Polymorphic outer membrane protein n=1 Tax=Stylonychia lemnae TaxID=5949 RepID=A0A078AMX5_STYLE|nr:UNKNOWN [Stylonychia lemnae]|eukprot:CDW83725.1 UNKNOWN [Stylonychia lemnae]